MQSKIIQHVSNQQNLNLEGKRQLTDTNVKITQLLELSDKDFKAAMMKML